MLGVRLLLCLLSSWGIVVVFGLGIRSFIVVCILPRRSEWLRSFIYTHGRASIHQYQASPFSGGLGQVCRDPCGQVGSDSGLVAGGQSTGQSRAKGDGATNHSPDSCCWRTNDVVSRLTQSHRSFEGSILDLSCGWAGYKPGHREVSGVHDAVGSDVELDAMVTRVD